ncbi:hypothetical protein PVAND_001132 [Polypedilum vanderplanki]|uniref:peptidyl-tRNA hydrolase n=1 Tax=Polypedilum vanderplanki TaxID=319348 RepID=A0A9J6BML6_POLVA|nr:hypothetical protein PVAND_001132 [Polypedilum vanderplanki]
MTLIQYIIVRKDLMKALKWNIGAVITQCCHAVAAINEMTRDNDELTKQYLSTENIDKMHKCVLGIENQEKLEELHKKLNDNGVISKLWIEQPENIPTCIALKPYEKESVQEYFKDLKLMR